MTSAKLDRLSNLLEERGLLAPGQETAPETVFTSIAFEPYPVDAGSLYVNLHGPTADARRHLAAAAGRGSVAACWELERGHESIPVLEVTHPRRALSAAAALLHGFPAEKLRTTGITGTNGKTTVALMLTRCLEFAGRPNGLVCSVAQKVADRVHPGTLTTPDAPELHGRLAEMVEAGIGDALLEVTSHGLMHERVADIPFRIAVLTNLSPDHLDAHPSMDHYLDTKARLFDGLPGDGLAIYNADDPLAERVTGRSPAMRLGVGARRSADVRLRDGYLVIGDRAAELLRRPPAELRLRLSVQGPHNRMNAALAAVTACALGADTPAVLNGLLSFPGVPRRLQTIYEGAFTMVDDLACSPGHYQALAAWLDANAARFRRLLVLTCPRGSRGAEINRLCAGELATLLPAHGVRRLLVSDCSGDIPPFYEILPEERAAFLDTLDESPLQVEAFTDNTHALQRAMRILRRGDCLVIMGTWGLHLAGAQLQAMLRARERRALFPRAAGRYYETDMLAGVRQAILPGEGK